MTGARMLHLAKSLLANLERVLFPALNPPFVPALCSLNHKPSSARQDWNFLDDLRDGFLWAVPKSRRTRERRLERKFGHPYYVWKPLVPKTNLLSCRTCGGFHEAGHLCSNCYSRVQKEVEEMQSAIEAKLKLDPRDSEVIVLYEGENQSDAVWEGKKLVEMKKPRPEWFSKNLLQRSTKGGPQSEQEGGIKPPTELA